MVKSFLKKRRGMSSNSSKDSEDRLAGSLPSSEAAAKPSQPHWLRLLKILGPGLIAGAADDDPSGIATYSQTGARFGFGQLWTALYQIPLLLAVQESCARIGSVTGKGLAGVIKDPYGRPVLVAMVLLVVIANTINIGADIGAVAAAAQLVIDLPLWIYALMTCVLVVSLEVLVAYQNYVRVLKWLALALLSYPATTFMIAAPWRTILHATFVPHLELTFGFLFIITGVFGTSISPYMFFWQASEEVEEEMVLSLAPDEDGKPKLPDDFIRNMRIDTAIGMIAAELVQWFIIITTGSVLFSHGITNINTAADAAKALEPLVHSFPDSGQVARDLFAVGIIGLGLLGIPVLAGSAAYALSEAFGWSEGLSRRFSEARGFYGVIILSTALGLLLNFIGIDPMKALVFTAVFNGIVSVPLLFVIGRINGDRRILGPWRGGRLSRGFVWLTFAVMALCTAALLYTLLAPS
jgi:NRAMP (natural resistance-associated macrophage protein)-like metal ion transporter